MPARVLVSATILASIAPAVPPWGAVPAPSPVATPPSVRVEVGGAGTNSDAAFLRGSLVLRALDHGYCITPGAADLVVTIASGSDSIEVTVAAGDAVRRHTVPGTGATAALEAAHRAEAALRAATTADMHGASCRAEAIAVQTQAEADEAWKRDWVAGLVEGGRPLVRADPTTATQICVRREPDAVVVGRGEPCAAAVRIPVGEDGRIDPAEVDRAVGAALAVASDGAHEVPGPPPVPEEAAQTDPFPVPEARPVLRESTSRPRSVPTPPPTARRRPPAPVVTLDALVGAGPVVRSGSIDGAAVIAAGLVAGPGIITALDVTMIGAGLQRRGVALDTDISGNIGYRLHLAPRSGLRFDGAVGTRVHGYRLRGDSLATGRVTWVVGAGVAGWWRVGRDLSLELGLRERVSGHGWIHEVGLDRVGERGRWTTMLVMGLAWQGRRR